MSKAFLRGKACRTEPARLRLSEAQNTSRAVLKDAANVSAQSQALISQSQTLEEELQRVCEQGQALREAGRKRRLDWRGEQAMPKARLFADASPAGLLLAAHPLLEPLPGAIVVQFIRCGKGGCHCQTGSRHGPYSYRMWRDGSVQKRYVPMNRMEEVKAQCALYLACQLELTRLAHERDLIRQRMAQQKKKFHSGS